MWNVLESPVMNQRCERNRCYALSGLRRCRSPWIPGRCPGLVCLCPTGKRRGVGPASRAGRLLALVLATCLGCMRGDADAPRANGTARPAPETPLDTEGANDSAGPADQGQVETTDEPESPTTPQMPPVVMSQEHAASLLVQVGDELPDATLTDLEGNEKSLEELLGERLTVVFFWSVDNIYSLQQLADMGPDIAQPYGVRVVGINSGDAADAALSEAKDAGAAFPILLDPDGAYLSQVSAAGPPLTFLVSQSGQVLWLDITYSRATRQALEAAIRSQVEGGGE